MVNGKGSRPYQRIRFSGEVSDLILAASSRSLIFRAKLPSAAACCCSVAKLCPILCNPVDCSTLLLCPSLSPGVCSISCLSSRRCHPTRGHCWPMYLQEILKHSKAGLAKSLWGLCVLVHTRYVWTLWASLAGMGFDSKHDFTPPSIFLGLLLCPWTWGISSTLLQHCTAAASAPLQLCASAALPRRVEGRSFFLPYSWFGCLFPHHKYRRDSRVWLPEYRCTWIFLFTKLILLYYFYY